MDRETHSNVSYLCRVGAAGIKRVRCQPFVAISGLKRARVVSYLLNS